MTKWSSAVLWTSDWVTCSLSFEDALDHNCKGIMTKWSSAVLWTSDWMSCSLSFEDALDHNCKAL